MKIRADDRILQRNVDYQHTSEGIKIFSEACEKEDVITIDWKIVTHAEYMSDGSILINF